MSNPNETINRIMKNFYAFNYMAGIACNSEGKRYGTFHSFPSRSLRDDYVADGGDFTTSPDYREAISTSDPELRSALRAADVLMESGAGWVESRWDANIYIH